MIVNGYYKPIELNKALTHVNPETGKIDGKAQIAISFGNRTAGKTVGHGINFIELFNEYKYRACLLTRTKEDMKDGYLEKWWESKIFTVDDADGIIKRFKKRKIEYTPEVMRVDGQDFCYCAPISMSAKVKDTYKFIRCANICMDEAVQRGERLLMLGKPARSAMSRIFEIWQTVARGWENAVPLTHIIFIANTSERDNWIFNDLGVNNFVRNDTKRTCQNGIYVEIINNKRAAKEIDESIMGSVMKNSVSGKSYYESAQNNMFLDNRAFIVPCSLDFRNCKIQLAVREFTLGIFETSHGFHVSKIERDRRVLCICNDVSNHTELTTYDPSGEWETILEEVYSSGNMTFQSQESKGLFFEYLSLRGGLI